MRNYFESRNGVVIPFERVERAVIGDHHTGDVVRVWTNSFSNIAYWVCDLTQLEDYKKWLHWKSIELELACKASLMNIQLIENHLAGTRSENPNNLTREQIKAVVKMGWEAKCDFCRVDVEADCSCGKDFDPTDEYVNQFNEEYSRLINAEPVGKSE